MTDSRDAQARPEPRHAVSGPRRWILLAGVWLCYASFGLVVTSLAPLVPLIEADLGLRHAQMGTVLGAWQLVYVFAAIPCGLLLDRVGPRVAVSLGGLIIAASALGRAEATGYVSLLIAVMLFGLGGPIVSAGAPKVVTELFTGARRGLAMGIYMTGPAIGSVVSLTLTHSVLLPSFDTGWRGVIGLWAAVAAASAGLWWIVAAGLPGTGAQGTSSRPPFWQGPRRLLTSPAIRLMLGMAMGVFAFNHALTSWLPERLRAGGFDLVEAGYWAAIPTIVGIGASLVVPRFATGERRNGILVALAVAALGASVALQSTQPGILLPGLLMQGVARATLMTVLILALVERPEVGASQAGTASGLFFSAAEIGGVAGPIGLGLLYDWTGDFVAGLGALSVIAVGLVAGCLRLRTLTRLELGGAHHAGPDAGT